MWTDRDVVIVFDSNVATNPKVQAARRALAAELATRGAHVRLADLPVEPGINGPDDFIGRHGDAALFALVDDARVGRSETPGADSPKSSQATRLVDLAEAAGMELWHTPAGDPYATIPVAGHREHHALSGRALREWLARLHHVQIGRTPGNQALGDALTTLAGMARYDGDAHAVSVRVGVAPATIWLDLGRPEWQAIQITADGWHVDLNPAGRMRRPRGMLPLPIPTAGGSLDGLRVLLPLHEEDDYRLVVAWLIGALHPTGPYPVLDLCGEQGAAKSTAARMLRRLIDPSVAELRAEPRDVRDLMVAASNSWIVAFDNVSSLTPWLSDAFCRLATGGALTTRQLYTDGDEHLMEAIRPVLLTGITEVVQRGDLQDRAISLTLPPIPERARRDEAELWRAYDAATPALLGGLLDAVVMALRRVSSVRPEALPRMADWARWTTAAEPALDWPDGTLLAAYRGRQQEAVEASLDGDPVAGALRAVPLPWTGTATELLMHLTPADRRPPRGWPTSPRALSGWLRRLAPQLRRVGITITTHREPRTGRRLITLSDGNGSLPSPPSPSSSGGIFPIDQGDDAALDVSACVTGPSPHRLNEPARGDDGDDGDERRPTSSREDRWAL